MKKSDRKLFYSGQKVYLAGPFFDKAGEQSAFIDATEKILQGMGFLTYSPKRHGGVFESNLTPQAKRERAKEIFQSNIGQVQRCDLMVAQIEGFDVGTMIEVGIAQGLNMAGNSAPIPVFATSMNPQRKVNLMLTEMLAGYTNDLDRLPQVIDKYYFNGHVTIFEGDVE
jgi:nucleoside 2-deoxyribosyltransferase